MSGRWDTTTPFPGCYSNQVGEKREFCSILNLFYVHVETQIKNNHDGSSLLWLPPQAWRSLCWSSLVVGFLPPSPSMMCQAEQAVGHLLNKVWTSGSTCEDKAQPSSFQSHSLSLIYEAPHLAFQHACWLGVGCLSPAQKQERRRWLWSSGGIDLSSLRSKTRGDAGWTLWLILVSFKNLHYKCLQELYCKN